VDAITQDEKTRLCDNFLNGWNTGENIEIELVATLPGYPPNRLMERIRKELRYNQRTKK